MQTNKLNQTSRMRLFLILPFAMLLGSLIVGSLSYSKAKVHLTEDLNEAMIHLANAKSALLANPDTIKALRHMKETVNQPIIIYKATDLEVGNELLQEATFFQLALLEQSSNNWVKGNAERVGKLSHKKCLADKGIISDSIVIIPQGVGEGIAIELTGYTECNMASVFFASDQRLSLILFLLSVVTFSLMWFKAPKRPKEVGQHNQLCQTTTTVTNELENPEVKEVTLNPNNTYTNTKTNQESSLAAVDLRHYKLTPMQRRFMEMMLQANEYRVGKYYLCEALWDGKSNAEESLYTLIRRTKQALNGSGIEIICNRGESYELHVKH